MIIEKVNNLIFFGMLIFTISSCNMSDTTKKLFGDYVFSTESRNNHAIVGGTNHIPPDVVNYEFDKDFLVVKQKPEPHVLVIEKANELLAIYENKRINPDDSIFLMFKEYGAGEK